MNSTQIRVCLLAWGAADEAQERAIDRAQRGYGRAGWEFVSMERRDGVGCPIDARNAPHALATDCGPGWAYAVYPARSEP